MYDLQEDRHEINNLYDNPKYATIQDDLKAELLRLQIQYGDPPNSALETLERFPRGSLPP